MWKRDRAAVVAGVIVGENGQFEISKSAVGVESTAKRTEDLCTPRAASSEANHCTTIHTRSSCRY
ncbi:uncharacterized protein PHALS_10075 [Plasmopara halstedii]|uniref:Uncharacterized protein n=1 Tax=Plasmopara halstedii TaxID=4781 RepID=A0A0P1AFS8_PLAHL|nr:uncharacterized protein PHALS_10075 [Plasmopara halstedii]CEG39842.1 hypothetical protein PHALS_10075 [Plasmopara halstedii]|eukprot:XP_024576211.1 hypothetical protein PHALS_10075 [Plasmopara halstedii]